MTSPADPVARVMATEFIALLESLDVAEAINRIRASPRAEGRPTYVYVVDGDRRLKGVLFLRDLIFSDPAARLADLSRKEVIRVLADTDQEEAARMFQQQQLAVLPVVDAGGRLVGTVTSDAVSRIVEAEATEDLLKVAGIALPVLLERRGLDPAAASGPLLTTLTDLCGFFFTLSLASLLIPYLK